MRRATSVTPAGTVKLEVPTCKEGFMKRKGTGVSKAAVARYMLHTSRMKQPTQHAVHHDGTEMVC
jgi:hypothetical protein